MYKACCVLFIFMLIVSVSSCKSDSKTKTSENDSSQIEQDYAYPPLPDTLRQRLMAECTQIEYLFTEGFSAASSTPGAVKEGIDHTNNIAVPKSALAQCKSLGRNQFLKGFKIELEADIYFSEPNCFFFIYKKNGQPLYSGMLKDNGKQFFSSVFNKVNPY
jgi:hypothetical protein